MQNILSALAWLSTNATLATALANGYQCLSAQRLATQHYPQLDLGLPLLITDVDSQTTARQIKHRLLNSYLPDHPITVLFGENLTIEAPVIVPLGELDQEILPNRPAICYFPPRQQASFTALQEIVAHLRAPEGCPWDRAQTLQSMRHDLLSECAEVLEAIDIESNGLDNSPHIAEELGDLLMAAVLMVQIATEENRFQMADVVQGIVTKLIRRHPHVFSDTIVDGIETVLTNWDAIKAQEKLAKGQTVIHPLDGVPAALPALEKARQLQSKAAKAKLLDRAALAQANPGLSTWLGPKPDEKRLGELLWQAVALAHQFELNPEDALRNYAVGFHQTALTRSES